MMIFDKSWYDKVTVDRFDKETKRQELNGAFRVSFHLKSSWQIPA